MNRFSVKKDVLILVTFCTLVLFGCVQLSSDSAIFMLRFGNRSGVPINSVVFTTDEAGHRFGSLGRSEGSKTVSGFNIRLLSEHTIEWQEHGVHHRITVDLSSFQESRKAMFSLNFYYQGKDEWLIVGRVGRSESSKELHSVATPPTVD